MPTPDPRRFPIARLAMLFNSTPLGPVTTTAKLRKLKENAGFAVSADGDTLDVLKVVAWLCARRHQRLEREGSKSSGPVTAWEELLAKEAQEVDALVALARNERSSLTPQ